MATGEVKFFATLTWDLKVPVPEAIAYGNNILLAQCGGVMRSHMRCRMCCS